MTYYPGITDREFMRVNYNDLIGYARWILQRRGISLMDDEIRSLLDIWYVKGRVAGILRSYSRHGSTIESYIRFCLDRSMLQVINDSKINRWYDHLTSLDERVTNDEGHITTMHETIGVRDFAFEYSDARMDVQKFLRWCADRVYSWRSKLRVMRVMTWCDVRDVHAVLGVSRQRVYVLLAGIRQDYKDFKTFQAGL